MAKRSKVTEEASSTGGASAVEQSPSKESKSEEKPASREETPEEQASVTRTVPASWRPPTTKRQAESTEIDWSRTYHVNSVEAFVNGLFGLYSGVFESFLADAGKEAELGETVLYQVKEPAHLRFELKKIGPNEFEVRGAHFATPSRVNICIGLDPLELSQTQAGAKIMYYYNPFTTSSTPTTTTGTPTTTTGTPTTTTTGTPTTSTWGTPTTTTGTPTTTTGTPTTTSTGTPTTSTWGTPTTTTGTPTTTTGTPTTTTTGTPTTSTWGTPTTSTSRPGFEEFLQSGGREVINLAKELRAQAKFGLEEDKFTDIRERLNRLAGLLENYRV